MSRFSTSDNPVAIAELTFSPETYGNMIVLTGDKYGDGWSCCLYITMNGSFIRIGMIEIEGNMTSAEAYGYCTGLVDKTLASRRLRRSTTFLAQIVTRPVPWIKATITVERIPVGQLQLA